MKLSLPVVFLLGAEVALAQRVCNNAAALCNRAYSNVTYLGAHDSPFVRNVTNQFSVSGDQFYDSVAQLNSGVRLLTAQVYNVNGVQTLCHTNCFLYNAGSLVSWLSGIKTWLDTNPNDVVTILLVNSMNANASTLDAPFQSANISHYGFVPSSTSQPVTDWPTLNNMIDNGKRLVVFIANLAPSSNTVAPYLLDEFTFVFENNYDNSQPSQFNCDINRPGQLVGQDPKSVISRGVLPLMNHFLYDNIGSGIEIPSVENVNNTNAFTGAIGNFGAAMKNCTTFYNRAPTFTLVDFENVAMAIDTVDYANGVQGQTSGRTLLPNTTEASMASPVPPQPQSMSVASSSASGATSSMQGSSSSPSSSAGVVPGYGSTATTSAANRATTGQSSNAPSSSTMTGDAVSQLENWFLQLLKGVIG